MFDGYKKINSKRKTNIRFVAADPFQIEFFELDGVDYFAIYKFNYGGDGNFQYYVVNLEEAELNQVSHTEFHMRQGISTYRLRVDDNKRKVGVNRLLWGWLPFSRMGGKATSTGCNALRLELEGYLSNRASQNT